MIKRHENGFFNQNTWLYTDINSNSSIVIDPGDELETLYNLIGDTNVTHIFITHGHIDHIQGLEFLSEKYPDAIIVAHELAKETLADPHKNLSHMIGNALTAPNPHWTYNTDKATIFAAGQEWTLIHTPGHSIDHTIFFGQDMTLFSGDLLFEEGKIGRVDFPGCDSIAMKISIAKMLSAPEETIAYPGHGNQFQIADIRPYFEHLPF